MKVFIPDQLAALFAFFSAGAAFGALYCVLRFLGMVAGAVPVGFSSERTVCPPPMSRPVRRVLVFLSDVTLFAVFSVVFCVMTYALADGRFRLYLSAAAAAGFVSFISLPGRLIRRLSGAAAFFIRAAIRAALLFAARPVIFAARATGRLFSAVLSPIRRRATALKSSFSEKIKEKRTVKGGRSSPRTVRRAAGWGKDLRP